jgi:hypothetical protein
MSMKKTCPFCGIQIINYPYPICKNCYNEKMSRMRFGRKSYSLSLLTQYLRNISKPWSDATLRYYKQTCQITGNSENVHVHHLFDFDTLYTIFLSSVDLPKYKWSYEIHPFNDAYTRKKFATVWLDILFSHGLGVCVNKGLHKLFHSNYGRKNLTPSLFYEFKDKLEHGYYDQELTYNKKYWSSKGIPRDKLLLYANKT